LAIAEQESKDNFLEARSQLHQANTLLASLWPLVSRQVNATFIAADTKESVRMKPILQAAKSEYLKLKRSLSDAEIKEWV
jgi:hypothetical protein